MSVNLFSIHLSELWDQAIKEMRLQRLERDFQERKGF